MCKVVIIGLVLRLVSRSELNQTAGEVKGILGV